jgi:hypothetical protein
MLPNNNTSMESHLVNAAIVRIQQMELLPYVISNQMVIVDLRQRQQQPMKDGQQLSACIAVPNLNCSKCSKLNLEHQKMKILI